MAKLYIYSTDEDNAEQAEDRFSPGSVVELGAGSIDDLQTGLQRLVDKGATFDRALIQTHGSPGQAKFGKEGLWYYLLDRDFAGHYSRLFPRRTKIYFDGCNVAAGDLGWHFLESAGKAFLQLGGGLVMGWASYGYAYSSWVPFIGGHTIHWGGALRFIEFQPGARETFRWDGDTYHPMDELIDASQRIDSY